MPNYVINMYDVSTILDFVTITKKINCLSIVNIIFCELLNTAYTYACYTSRRSRTRDTVKLSVCLCVYSSCNCSTVAMRRKLTASIGF